MYYQESATRALLFLGSSVVERRAVNADVPGSNPGRGAARLELLCLSLFCYDDRIMNKEYVITDNSKFMFHIKTKLWRYQADTAAWHFLTIDEEMAKKIKSVPLPKKRGWGSIRVQVTIGETTWTTSIFPTKEGEYVLPVKAAVRKREQITDGDLVLASFEPVMI